MKIKNNPLACGIIGAILGSGATLGGQALLEGHPGKQGITIGVLKSKDNFDLVPYSPNGNVVITRHGKKYHIPSCYTLQRSKELQTVNVDDAEEAGLSACSKCI